MRLSLDRLDRRVIYALVLAALSLPLIAGYTVKPARMQDAERFFRIVEDLAVSADQYAFLAMDFGPNTKAENEAQAEVLLEHLMRRRVPVILFSQYVYAEPFLKTIPERVAGKLELEHQGQKWIYGKDWMSLGYQPGGSFTIQAIPKSQDLGELFGTDARGNAIRDLPGFGNFHRLEQIRLLAEFTGLVGVFDSYLQFFKKKDYAPLFGHGCTSITIPQAFIYLDSGQIQGLMGGIAGAAWYSQLLSGRYPKREGDASLQINTGLGVAQLVIILMIIAGNAAGLMRRGRSGEAGGG